MLLPVQITIRDIPNSPALENHIRQKAEKLNRFYDHICSCRVVVELPKKHLNQGKLYNVRVDLAVPGKELVVTRKCNADVYVAIRDAFDAVARQLENHSRKRHGNIKTHPKTVRGFVTRVMPDQDYGFIEGMDGTDYYVSTTNANLKQFASKPVEFETEYQGEGQQAIHVRLRKKSRV